MMSGDACCIVRFVVHLTGTAQACFTLGHVNEYYMFEYE